MENNTAKKDVEGYLSDLLEIHEIFAHKTDNEHLLFLLEMLKNEGLSLKKLFDYGVSHLPDDDGRPDVSLSTYFFVLSEIKELPEAVRSFAMDVMIYCENDSSFFSNSTDELLEEYKKITPLL